MYKLGINFDEVSSNLDTALDFLKKHDLTCGELRMVDEKNFVFWDESEIARFKKSVANKEIELVAAATPLFKWYMNEDDPEIVHDSFGFNPRIGETEKRRVIVRAIAVAAEMNIPRLRIFSGLGATADAGKTFADDPILKYALDQADAANVDLYLENEPVCRIHDKEQILQFFKNNGHPRLKFWLDIANLTELNEEIDDSFIAELAPRLGYLHIKDYRFENGRKRYVPAGEGEVDYKKILGSILRLCENDLIITVETHAQDNKVEMSARAIAGTRLLLNEQGVNV